MIGTRRRTPSRRPEDLPMPVPAAWPDFSAEQLELWQHVHALWRLAAARDGQRIQDALQPDYMGWDMSAALPHDREAAVRSVTGDAPNLTGYELEPLSVRVYEGRVGVVHCRYRATVQPQGGPPAQIAGRWTEVDTRCRPRWLMVAVSGQPGPVAGSHGGQGPVAGGAERGPR